jgi:SAM-dependent methyltransferase
MVFDQDYWDKKYLSKNTGWDLGYPSPPIKDYANQITNKKQKILIPGAGNAWEVEYMWNKGFKNIFLLDLSYTAVQRFRNRVSSFPEKNIFQQDFFTHSGKYDLILEQTFLSSLSPKLWENYVQKMHDLLIENGKLVGVFFNHAFLFPGPPFGAKPETYTHIFGKKFDMLVFKEAYNSIKPRKGREHFFIFRKRAEN